MTLPLSPAGSEVTAAPPLAEADATDELAGLALEARTPHAEFKRRQGARAVLALDLLYGLGRELDDGEHVLVVGLDDLALVASRERVDGDAANRPVTAVLDGRLEHLLELVNRLLGLGDLVLGLLGLVLGGRDLVLQRGDLGVELVDLRLDLGDLVLELGLLALKLGDAFLLFANRHLVLTGDGLELVELVHDALELAAEIGERGAGGVQAGLLGLGGLDEPAEEFVLRALAALEELVAVHDCLPSTSRT